jgi:hypothetical protein
MTDKTKGHAANMARKETASSEKNTTTKPAASISYAEVAAKAKADEYGWIANEADQKLSDDLDRLMAGGNGRYWQNIYYEHGRSVACTEIVINRLNIECENDRREQEAAREKAEAPRKAFEEANCWYFHRERHWPVIQAVRNKARMRMGAFFTVTPPQSVYRESVESQAGLTASFYLSRPDRGLTAAARGVHMPPPPASRRIGFGSRWFGVVFGWSACGRVGYVATIRQNKIQYASNTYT